MPPSCDQCQKFCILHCFIHVPYGLKCHVIKDKVVKESPKNNSIKKLDNYITVFFSVNLVSKSSLNSKDSAD